MLRQGQHRAELPSLLLSDPKAKAGSKSRGAVEGSYSLLERPGGAVSTANLGGSDNERIIGALRADLDERDREISRLRAQLGLPAAPVAPQASLYHGLAAAPQPHTSTGPGQPAPAPPVAEADAVVAHRRVSGGQLGAHPSGTAVLSGQLTLSPNPNTPTPTLTLTPTRTLTLTLTTGTLGPAFGGGGGAHPRGRALTRARGADCQPHARGAAADCWRELPAA
jgi:hypothetical protein